MVIRTLLKNTLFMLAAMSSLPALAASDSGYKTITELHFNPVWPGVLVRYSTTMTNTDACGRADWYYLPKTHAQYQEIYSLLLAARTANKPVRFYNVGCQSPSGSTAPVINAVYL